MGPRRRRGETGQLLRLFALAALSVALMVADHRTDTLQRLRSWMALAVTPLQVAAALPAATAWWVSDYFTSRHDLRESYDALREQHASVRARLQKLEAIEAENVRLRRLLAASERVADKVLMAELVEVSLEPFVHTILVNRGLTDGVYAGQPVIDPNGVMGQVARPMPFTSAVTLITDPSHAIPVQVQRNGLRAIVFGIGRQGSLSVPNLSAQSDITAGDVLVTSGMAGRFPSGLPVARVTGVVKDPNEPFLQVEAEPVAQLDHAREVLLIWPEGRGGAGPAGRRPRVVEGTRTGRGRDGDG